MNAVHTLRKEHTITILCRVLHVNRSSYYKHFYGPTAPRTLLNQRLRQLIFKIYHDNDLRLGVAKINQLIKVEYGLSVSNGRIYRLMKTMNLPLMSTRKPRFKYQTAVEDLHLPNQLQQQFNCHHPNTTWTSDMTYIHTDQGFVYLCIVLDLFARKVVSWQLSAKMDQNLILSTFQKAVAYRQPPEGLLLHTDRGSQYLAHNVRQFLDQQHITHSYSKPGYPWDNAVTESFFKYLKQEELNRRHFKDLATVKQAVFQYIEGFYNPRRPHSVNNMLAPNQKEAKYFSELN
jgi:putative transposase